MKPLQSSQPNPRINLLSKLCARFASAQLSKPDELQRSRYTNGPPRPATAHNSTQRPFATRNRPQQSFEARGGPIQPAVARRDSQRPALVLSGPQQTSADRISPLRPSASLDGPQRPSIIQLCNNAPHQGQFGRDLRALKHFHTITLTATNL